MKKGVVLLITLFFITAISVLVLKNLDDTDKFLEKQNYIINNTQAIISIKNIKDEVSKILKRNLVNMDKAFGNIIPLSYDKLNIKFKVNRYNRTNINDINNNDSNSVLLFFQDNNIYDYDYFVQIYKEKFKNNDSQIENSKQLNDIINNFVIKSENKEILMHKDKLGFIDSNDNKTYELFINVDYLDANANAYYILKNTNGIIKVENFDISFK
ncbi:MAG: hypothetical protein GY932_14765 [Arcobacter sp.]|nr:hypothetical protein [Arcobacter sp.]